MKRKKKRQLLSWLLTLTVMLTTILGVSPGTAIAAAGAADGQVEYVGGTTSATGAYDIDISKTIEAVSGKENYFDITLKATTHRHNVDMSTDVVLVLDISNTMNSNAEGDSTTNVADRKITYAKNATKTFVEAFATNSNLDTDRKVGIVTFNRDAYETVSLTLANTKKHADDIAEKIDKITAPTADEVKWTNIEGGLRMAEEMLKSSTAKYKYVILLTDGFPTTYLPKNAKTNNKTLTGHNPIMGGKETDAKKNYNSARALANNGEGEDGYFANTRIPAINYGGTSYSNRAAEKALAKATSMKSDGINIFSVGVAISSQDLSSMWEYIIDTTGMAADEAYAIGNTKASYKNWLENKISGGPLLANSNNKYSDAYNQSELVKDFKLIMTDIERAPEVTMREFYTLDPMSEVADFVGFYNKNGKLLDEGKNLSGESKQNAENTAVFGGSGNANRINWNLMKSGYTMNGQNLVFTLKYRVRLTNEKSGFVWQKSYLTNGTTTLNYSQKYAGTNTDVPGGSGTLNYKIPKVEGYKGSLKFKKVDENSNAFAKVEFILRHDGDSCDVCGGDAVIKDMKSTSGAGGYVTFDNIPSGHRYTLIETEPEGYAPIHNHTIIVSYGQTYVGSVSEAHKLTDGRFGNGNDFVIKNTKDEPVEIQIQVTKTMEGRALKANEFSFLLTGNEIHGHDTGHYEVAKNDANGNVLFSDLIFDEPGTYTYTISEITGTDPNVIYSSVKHTVQVVVAETLEKNAYKATVTVDSNKSITYTGVDNKIEILPAGSFVNKIRTNGTAEIKAKKLYNGQNAEADKFSFKLEAVTEGAPMPTNTIVKNAANGMISFGRISYSTPGTYVYRITEEIGSDKSIVYDTTAYEATVTVHAPEDLKNDAALSTSIEYKDARTGETVTEVTFVNKNRVVPTLKLKGYKTLNDKKAEKDRFTFVLQEIDDDGNVLTNGAYAELINGADGIINFDGVMDSIVTALVKEINDNSANASSMHNYKIYEKLGSYTGTMASNSNANMIYDDTYYELQVGAYVTEGSDHYSLFVMMEKNESGYSELVFRDEIGYHVDVKDVNGNALVLFDNESEVFLELNAQKILGEGAVSTLDGFEFVLEDKHGEVETVTSDASGKIQFSPIKFTADDVGTHDFVIYEKEGDRDLFYDDSIYTVEVNVYVDEDGNLKLTETSIIDEYNKSFTDIVFENKKLDPTHLHLKVQKRVNGEMPTVAQKFNFELRKLDQSGNVQVDDGEVMHNVHGIVAFTHLTFEESGEYNYLIREVIPGEDQDANQAGIQYDGYTYDDTEFKIRVKVTKATSSNATPSNATPSNATPSNATYTKEVFVNGERVEPVHNTLTVGVFNNMYEAPPVELVVKGTKVLKNARTDQILSQNAEDFEFVIMDGSHAICSAKNQSDGTFVFDALAFKEAGTYHYTIREVNTHISGMHYDKTVYDMVVKVILEDHKLVIESVQYTVNNAAVENVVFINECMDEEDKDPEEKPQKPGGSSNGPNGSGGSDDSDEPDRPTTPTTPTTPVVPSAPIDGTTSEPDMDSGVLSDEDFLVNVLPKTGEHAGVGVALALSILALMGLGVQSYGKRKKKME